MATLVSIAGAAALLLGIALNPWTVAILVKRPWLHSWQFVSILVFDALAISFGLLLIWYRRAITVKKLLLAGFSGGIPLFAFVCWDFYCAGQVSDRSITYMDGVHEPDNTLGWKPKPGSVGRHFLRNQFDVAYEMDQRGFKKVPQAPDAETNLFFFGDSFTFGYGVSNDDTFANVIAEEYLNDSVAVHNGGGIGYGLVQQVQRFLTIADRLKPKDIVVFTPLSADIARDFDSTTPRIRLLNYVLSNPQGQPPVRYYPVYENGSIAPRKIDVDASWIGKLKLRAINAPLSGRVTRRVLVLERSSEELTREAHGLIDLARKKTEQREAIFALIFLPRVEECAVGEYMYDVSSFDYFDIRGFFPNDKQELEKLVFEQDRHWNARGHQVGARAIVETLLKQGILEPRLLREKVDSAEPRSAAR